MRFNLRRRKATIHSAPIPSLKSLILGVFAKTSKADSWLSKSPLEYSVQSYSRGAWALDGGISQLLKHRNKNNGLVFVPDYLCDEALTPLRMKNRKLYFYPVRQDLSPDWDKLEIICDNNELPDVFVLVHYFGFTNCLSKAEEFCKIYGIELIEDCAHLLIPTNNYGQNTAIFSPWKHLPLANTGLLRISNSKLTSSPIVQYSWSKIPILKWLTLRMLQRIMLMVGFSWHRFRKKRVNSETIQGSTDPYPTRYSLKLLTVYEQELDKVIRIRRSNYESLWHSCVNRDGVQPLFELLPDDISPYAFPLIVSRESGNIISAFNENGVPAYSWPNLPQEVIENSKEHKTANWLQRHLMLLPVHQDLSARQIEYVISVIDNIFEKVKE